MHFYPDKNHQLHLVLFISGKKIAPDQSGYPEKNDRIISFLELLRRSFLPS
jgi:hypothetical protein